MKRIDYDEHQHRVFHEGRALSPEARTLWIDLIRRRAPGAVGGRILDIGSGTGRFAELFASELHATVLGVEPSGRMREDAERRLGNANIRYVAGLAEQLPCSDQSFELAWLSRVLHHLSDLGRALAEVRRVLSDDGRAIVRSSFSGRLAGIPCYAYFPEAKAIDDVRMPSLDTFERAVQTSGLEIVALETLRQITDENLAMHLARLRKGAVSTFELMQKADVEAGFRRLAEAAQNPELNAEPVTEDIDVVVLQKA